MLATGTMGLGVCRVSGRSRAPFPPARMNALITITSRCSKGGELYHICRLRYSVSLSFEEFRIREPESRIQNRILTSDFLSWYRLRMRFRGLRLLRVGGIQIVIDYSWFVIFFLVMYTMAENYFPQTERQRFTTPQYWLMGLVGATLLFVSVLLHELAHSFVALWQGIRVNSIRLFIFGGVAQVSSEPGSGRSEFLIALAGPATSLVLALLFGAVSIVAYIAGGARVVAAIAQYVAIANFILGLFNM